MTKRIVIAAIALVLLAGLGFAGAQREAAEGPQSIVISQSTIAAPDSSQVRAANRFKLEIERMTQGRISSDVYSAGQIFTQEGELAAAREGTLDVANYAASWVAEFVPYLGQLGAVYTFSSYEHMRAAFSNEEIWSRIVKDVSDTIGVVPLVPLYLGTRQLNLVESVGPVRHPDQMKGVKLRTPNSPSWIALGKALGASPTPLSFGEVYMALRTGVVEGQDNPLNTNVIQKFYEPTKYIILTDHVVDTVWPSINKARWESFSDEDRALILEAWEVAREFNDQLVLQREAEARAFMESQGTIFIDDPDKDAFIEYAKWSYQNESQNVSKNWDWDFYEKIQALRP